MAHPVLVLIGLRFGPAAVRPDLDRLASVRAARSSAGRLLAMSSSVRWYMARSFLCWS
jgi:hypothetical protein